MTTLFLPSGAEAKYQAVSVDVFPNWNAVFTPLNMEETFKKIHPDKDIQQTFSEIGKARTLARRELYVVQERLTPGTKISQR